MERPSTSMDDYRFKVVLLGEGAVGKSSLMLRFVENRFNQKHLSTITASFLSKVMEVDGESVELNIWDTAGQEKFHALGPIYYRNSQGALLVYDITDSRSFEKVKVWARELRRSLGDDVCVLVVGNKLDLERERNVSYEDAEGYASEVGAEYMEVSAKDNINIQPMFEKIAYKMLTMARTRQAAQPVGMGGGGGDERRSIQLIDDQPQRKKRCC